MNWFEKVITKAMPSIAKQQEQGISIDDKILRAVMQYIGNGSILSDINNKLDQIRNGYDKNIFVYMVVNYIASKGANVEWKLYKRTKTGNKENEVTEHPILDLIRQPSGITDEVDFKEQLFGFYLITGNSYVYKAYSDITKKYTGLYLLPPQYTDIIVNGTPVSSDSDLKYNTSVVIEGYRINIISLQTFAAKEVVHIKMPNYNYANGQFLYGQSPLVAMANVVTNSNLNIEASSKQSKNQGAMGALMYADEQMATSSSSLTEPQMRTIERKIDSKINGTTNQGRIAILNAKFDYKQFGLTSRDLQLIETHNMNRADIAAAYKLSSILFNDSVSSTYNNFKEARKAAWVDAIIPLVNKVVSEFNREVVWPLYKDVELRPDFSKVPELQDDYNTMVQSLKDAYWIPTSVKQQMTNVEVDNTLPEYFIPNNITEFDAINGIIPNPNGDYNINK